MAAEACGRQNDTVQFASMMGGIAAVLTGADAQEANVASQAGANAAANNYISHSPYASVRKLVAEENARLTQACGVECMQEDFTRIDAQMHSLESAAQLLETQKRSKLTAETRYESLSQGSRIEGGIVSITANGAITGEGVKLKGDDGVLVQAAGALDLHEARDIRRERVEVGVAKSTSLPGTGLSVPGTRTDDSRSTSSDTASATTVESGNGGRHPRRADRHQHPRSHRHPPQLMFAPPI